MTFKPNVAQELEQPKAYFDTSQSYPLRLTKDVHIPPGMSGRVTMTFADKPDKIPHGVNVNGSNPNKITNHDVAKHMKVLYD